MNIKEIKELIKIIDASSLSELHIEQDQIKLTIKKENGAINTEIDANKISEYLMKERLASLSLNGMNHFANAMPSSNNATDLVNTNVQEAVKIEENLHTIKSPIVGIFYSSPNPDSPAFVKVGDKVKVGQVLCIVEAMKMMNEIASDVEGEVVEVLADNQGPVEYGQSLFKIRKA